ncbi:MAG: DNA polymerase III [Campylobacteraceae bacterium 4484_4]|nr:MAG: DNA polymerase III [Campylobacteraceae bacterium 4484_4]
MQNLDVVAIFNELADLLEIKGENPFKVRAYRNAARVLESLGESVEGMVDRGEDLTKLPGIGEDLAEKIKEIVRTGKLQKLEALKKEIPESLRSMLSIEGLGPKRVKILYEKLHLTDTESLEKAAREHKISALEGFGPKTEEAIIKGVRLLKQEGVRHLFAEAEPIADELVSYLKKAPGLKSVDVAGSFRRKKETVGDLDVLCIAKKPAEVIDYFTKFERIAEVVSAGTTRATVVLKNALQIDLRAVKEESYGAALHYFTGSKTHVIAVRKIAIDMGLKINEYGVYRGEKKIAGRDEAGVYKTVKLPFIPPELREDRGEIEAAAKGGLPNLIERSDLRGDLHMHTTYSDGIHTIEEMVQKAQRLGYEYIAITDHSPGLAMIKGLDVKKAQKQIEEIDRLNEKLKNFRILKGMEVDIHEDGSLDMEKAILEALDIVTAAVHSKFSLSKKEQTKRVLKAIENPLVHVIAHPTGRLIGKRKAILLDMEKIYKEAAKAGVAMEINAQPERLDLNDIHIREAKEHGVKFTISTDAHAKDQLDFIRYGINQARRGWIEKGDVLNTQPLKKLLKTLVR